MRIGILTFHRAYNFGAFLQAFALKTYLEEMGHKVEFVDYWPKEHSALYKTFYWEEVKSLKGYLRECLVSHYRRGKARPFVRAQRKILGLDKKPRYEKPQQLSEVAYDLIVYGSDQIWWKSRLKGVDGFDVTYWGGHIPETITRASYAASMGAIELDANDKQIVQQLLKGFSHISVRENQLKNSIQPLTEKKIEVNIDPTFLLEKECWEKLCTSIPESKGKYILYYRMMIDEEADRLAQQLSLQTGYPIVHMDAAIGSYRNLSKYTKSASPFDFISLIRNAEYVVSTSFHGVAFSVIFEKQFYAIGMGNRSNRVQSLLSSLGIEQRLIRSKEDIMALDSIDYVQVKERLRELRQQAADYLTRITNERDN